MSYGFIFIFLLILKSTDSCGNVEWNNKTFGHVENLNFFEGKSQPNNQSCLWKINHEKQGYYVVSLRIIEVEDDERLWSNELILKSDQKQILVNDLDQRIFYFPFSSNLEINFRSKSQPNTFNIHRFLLEFIYVNNNLPSHEYFRCEKSGLIIPKQWICNCLYECLFDDESDEENCPLCSIIQSTNSLLCHSKEIWCLPNVYRTDSKGVCLPSDQNAQCLYSTKCETILSFSQDHGEILIDNSLLSKRQSLCFILIAKEKHKIRLIISQSNFLNRYPEYEFEIYDGSEQENQVLISSNSSFSRQIVQTRQNHLATIIIRKRLIVNQTSLIEQRDRNNLVLHIAWLTTVCPDNQILCSGHFETKCYSNAQRCDGIWDCISGDDELGCLPSSCPTTFACYNQLRLSSDRPRCYTWFERCNGNAFCANHLDEQNCTNWWCNSNNGTFLCQNRKCIYETWRCDGANDCGDHSDEINCPSRVSRRLMTAVVIGAMICCTLFLIALGFTCKLFHLRSVEQRASTGSFNPQEYIEQRRPNDSQPVAPPSYNQTMGFSNDHEERQAIFAEHLRQAGLANFIPLASRHRPTHHEDLSDGSMERHSTNPFDRFRSIFTRNFSSSIPTDEIDISERPATISSFESRELPPPYSDEPLLSSPIEDDEQANSDDEKMLMP